MRVDGSRLVAPTSIYAGHDLATALTNIQASGVDAVDIWAAPGVCDHLPLDHTKPAEVARIAGDLGLTIAAVSAFRHDESGCRRLMEWTAELGCDLTVLGYRPLGPETDDWYGAVEPLIPAAAELGIRLALENHRDHPLESGDQIAAAMRHFADAPVGMCLAPTHLFTTGNDPATVIADLGEKLFYYYFWDVPHGIAMGSRQAHALDPFEQSPGGGQLDFRSHVRALEAGPFEGLIGIFWHGSEGWPVERVNALLLAGAAHARAAIGESRIDTPPLEGMSDPLRPG
jgi:sugar phosphate isomerase/epimerase